MRSFDLRKHVEIKQRDMDEEDIHVAVGTNFKREKANILWVAANFPTAMITLVHVHWPSKWMPFMGGKVLYKFADEQEKAMHRKRELDEMARLLSQYKSLCGGRKVKARYLENEDVLGGITSLVKSNKIKRLVIGSRYMTKQKELRECCQIWLVLNGKHFSISNDLLEHTEKQMGHGEDQESETSIDELSSDESEAYATPPSDLGAEFTDEEDEIQIVDTSQLAMENGIMANQDGEESLPDQDGVETFYEEAANPFVEQLKFRNDAKETEKLREEIDRLQRRLKELERGDQIAKGSCLEPKQKDTLSKQKNLTKRKEQELLIPEHITQFCMSQLGKATNNFHPKNLLGGGGYGPVYKGKLGGMQVAIKLLKPDSRQGPPQCQHEVQALSTIKHPNIIKLIGVCSESCALVYEHLPNGTLEERLAAGLAWQDRIRIIVEQRSAIMYLHSSRPHAIIHADLKLTNILLDANDISRLGDFGTARLVHVSPLEEVTICRKTTPMGTRGYMDPVFFMTGELTTESDVYAFGIIILQLLTGMLALDIAERVKEGLKSKAMHRILDASAGDWPIVQAECLLRLALRCCSFERKRRPGLTSSNWKTLDKLHDIAGKSRKK